MPQPEATFKKYLKESFESLHGLGAPPGYWLPLVASMMQRAGIPDLYVADGATCAWIEAKVNGNGLSPTQSLEMCKMAMAGSLVIVLHTELSVPEISRMIDWKKFTREGRLESRPAFLRWDDAKTPMFWYKAFHG